MKNMDSYPDLIFGFATDWWMPDRDLARYSCDYIFQCSLFLSQYLPSVLYCVNQMASQKSLRSLLFILLHVIQSMYIFSQEYIFFSLNNYSWQSSSSYYKTSTKLRILHIWSHLILMIILWGRYNYYLIISFGKFQGR